MKSRNHGFSLLEVLVAFVILALALGVLMRIFSGGLNNISTAQGYAEALALAESKLAAAGIDPPLQEGETSGHDEQGHAWRLTIAPYQAAASEMQGLVSPVDLYQVEVFVRWDETRSNPRSLKLSTLRALPKP